MSSDMNRICIVGRLVKNPELRHTQAGTPVCSLSIASNKSYVSNNEKKEQVSYFNLIAWGKLGETINKYCAKGHRVGIDGHLQQRSWTDKDGKKCYTIEIVVDQIQFLQPMTAQSNNTPPADPGPAPKSVVDGEVVNNAPPVDIGNPFDDSDIPF